MKKLHILENRLLGCQPRFIGSGYNKLDGGNCMIYKQSQESMLMWRNIINMPNYFIGVLKVKGEYVRSN